MKDITGLLFVIAVAELVLILIVSHGLDRLYDKVNEINTRLKALENNTDEKKALWKTYYDRG